MLIYLISCLIIFFGYITLLAEFDIFYTYLLIVGLLGIVIFFLFIVLKKKIKIEFSKSDIPAYIIIIIFTLYTSLFFHDNYYGSRDPGMYLNNAIYLSKNHTLKVPTKLNPNVIVDQTYDQTKYTQNYFLIRMEVPHMAWIATFVALFGYLNINFVFFIPTLLGLFCLYFMFKETTSKRIAIITLILYLSSFAALWWFRSTAVENNAFFFLFSSFYLFFIYLRKKSIFCLIISIIAMGFYALVRSEGFINLLIFISILIYTTKSSGVFQNKKYIYLVIVSILLIFFLNMFFIIYFFARYQYLTTIQELPNIISHITRLISLKHTSGIQQINQPEAWDSNLTMFVNMILTNYGLYLPIILILVLFIDLLRKIINERKNISLNNKFLFFIILIIIPNLYLLYKPQIALDQPWFLRRFYHLLIPFGYFTFVYYLNRFKNKIIITFVFILIFITNILISLPTLLPNNKGVIQQVETFSSHIPNNALVISDNDSIQRYPIAESLYFIYGKKVVKIFKESDIQYLKPLLSSNSKIYFILDNTYSKNYPSILTDSSVVYKQTFTINKLLQTCELWNFTSESRDYIYNVCRDWGIPNEFQNISDTVSVYSVKDINKLLTLRYK